MPFPAVAEDDGITIGGNAAPFKDDPSAKLVHNPTESEIMININIRGSMDNKLPKPKKKEQGKHISQINTFLGRGTSTNKTANILRASINMSSSSDMPSDMPSREFNDSYLDKRNTDLAERMSK